MTFTMQWQIECPPEVAFEMMADVRNEVRWNDDVSSAELLTDEPIGLGSRFATRHPWPLGRMESTITEFERPHRFGTRTTAKSMDLTVSATFTATDTRTVLSIQFDPKPKGVMKVLLPILLPMIRRDIDKQHQSFNRLCEEEASQSSSF